VAAGSAAPGPDRSTTDAVPAVSGATASIATASVVAAPVPGAAVTSAR
jgi:hypothetical protein